MESGRYFGVECAGGSRSHNSEHAAEAVDFGTDGDIEGQNGNQIVQEFSSAEKETVLGKSFLEPRILCQYIRSGREQDKALCEISGREGAARGGRTPGIRPLLEAGP